MSVSISCSEKLEYRTNCSIFSCLEKTTNDTSWLRPQAFLAAGASNLTRLIFRTTAVVEVTIHSLGLILNSSSENRMRGKMILKQVPMRVAVWLVAIPGILVDSAWIVYSPKFYIASHIENAKVDAIHLQAGTINSRQHKHESLLAIGRVKGGIEEG